MTDSTSTPGLGARLGPLKYDAVGLVLPLAATIYLAGLRADTIGIGDEGELQVLAWQMGLPHCNGYPLYIWLGALASHLFPGPLPARLPMLSVLCGGLCLLGLYALARALTPQAWRWLSIGTGLIAQAGLLASPIFVRASLIAEMYTLQWALTLAVLLLLVHWRRTGRARSLYGGAVLLGAMFGNHITTVLLLPGVGLFTLAFALEPDRRRSLWGALGCAAAGFAVGDVLLYWLLWRRHLPFDHWNGVMLQAADALGLPEGLASSPLRSWAVAARCGQVAGAFAGASQVEAWSHFQRVGAVWLSTLGPFGAAFAAVGAVAGWKRDRRLQLLLTTLLLVQTTAVVFQTQTDKHDIFLMVPTIVTVLWACIGNCWLLPLVASRFFNRSNWPLVPVGLVAMLATKHLLPDPSPALRRRPPEISRRIREGSFAAAAQYIVGQVPEGAILFAAWDIMYALQYEALIQNKNLRLFESGPEGTEFHVGSQRVPKRVPKGYAAALEEGRQGTPLYCVSPLPSCVEPGVPVATHGWAAIKNPLKLPLYKLEPVAAHSATP